jgi:hypothetical protein
LVNIFKPNERGDDILLFKWYLLHKYWRLWLCCWGRIQKTTFNSDSNNSKKLSAGLNASYLYSNQELNADKVNRETVFQVDFTKQKENSLVHLIYCWPNVLSMNGMIKNNLTTTIAYTIEWTPLEQVIEEI